jgi:hypothetical protein
VIDATTDSNPFSIASSSPNTALNITPKAPDSSKTAYNPKIEELDHSAKVLKPIIHSKSHKNGENSSSS